MSLRLSCSSWILESTCRRRGRGRGRGTGKAQEGEGNRGIGKRGMTSGAEREMGRSLTSIQQAVEEEVAEGVEKEQMYASEPTWMVWRCRGRT
jgi:hypothetical protein